MRQLLSFAVLTAIASLGLACRDTAAANARPTPRGEFRVLVPFRPSTLNPNLQLDEVALVIGHSVFNHLLTLNEAGRLLPDLAQSWTMSPDGLTYTFKLRNGVRWHDGVPFSAADVRWTLAAVANDGFGGKDALAPVQSVDTPDPLTVVITLKYPWAPFASDLAGPGLFILPRHVYEGRDWRTDAANDRPIGTGPFRFERWADDRTLLLDANPDFFRSGPYVRRLIFEVAPPDAVAEKLLRGEADYSVVRPASMDLSGPLPDPLAAQTLPTSGRLYIAMNLRRPPFNDVRVRRALASAVNRPEIIQQAIGGLGAPAIGWYTPDVEWAYNTAARVPDFDLDAAQRSLRAAGLPLRGGHRLRASLIVANAAHHREIGMTLRRQFAAIGVRLDVEPVATPELPKRVIESRDFDLALLAGGQGPDPDQLRRRFLADTESGAFIGYDAADFREAVERGARAVDVADRAAAYHRAQEILARDVPFIPIAESVKVVVHSRRVSGLPQLEARGLVGVFDFSLVKLGPRSANATR